MICRTKFRFLSVRAVVIVLLFVLALPFLFSCGKEDFPAETVGKTLENTFPLEESVTETQDVLEEKRVRAHGIDVSKWQGKINWSEIKEAEVDFAMIRIGYRDGENLYRDPMADYNLREAEKYKIPVGVYFYSAAKTEGEAIREAEWVLQEISPYYISYPVAMDVEIGSDSSDVSAKDRTKIAFAFLDCVQEGGYEAMLYAPLTEFENPDLWDAPEVLGSHAVWIASYDSPSYPEAQFPQGMYEYAMWQYSNTGSVKGISGAVDRNVSYFTPLLSD